MPHFDLPSRTPPDITQSALRREQQREPKFPVLPSATVALPCAASPRHAPPHLTGPHQNYPLKRAAEEAEASCAAVCNCHFAGPGLANPCPTPLSLAASTLQREQQGEPKPSVLPSATVTLPEPAMPRHAPPQQTPPHWGLHQRMPSMIRLLQRASGSDFQ
jgi:hypothetical protein